MCSAAHYNRSFACPGDSDDVSRANNSDHSSMDNLEVGKRFVAVRGKILLHKVY